MEKIAQVFALSSRDTLSARIVRVSTVKPEAEMPCSARPSSSIPYALVGAPVHKALPITMSRMEEVIATLRPNTSAICAQNGIKADEVRLKAETIQFCWEILSKSLAIQKSALAILKRS